ncbi:hypothetical protein HIM_04956 [Hirsutella minnesotensis 3608]|uniref:Uncharacterized protein n=1 Tax=Hirsutella minnesotensis 3608 TaxID=1043627 RepID=A0A0F8A5R7_9HYPO|nr:hypothetical protein HIM_04956 [Hirsutella minnesotensis 3608]
MTDDSRAVYTLHYFPFSLYSLMARFAFVLGRELNPATAPTLEIRLVSTLNQDNLSEAYLTQVNKKGQVPALTSPALESTLDDSYAIAKWLCKRQPELLPEEHRETIERLMDKLYTFHAKVLLEPPENQKHGVPNQAAAMLESTELTEGHRRALEIKSLFHDTFFSWTLDPNGIVKGQEQAREFLRELDVLLGENGEEKKWLFGPKPTILDAYAWTLVARLMEWNRFDVIPERVRRFTEKVLKTEEWNKVTHGRPTRWTESVGDVAKLNPI